MKKLGTFLLGAFAVMPVFAQDQPAADAAAPAAEAAPAADAAPAPAADATAATPATSDATPAAAAAPASDAAPAAAPAADASAPAADATAAAPAASDAAAAPAGSSDAAPAADAAAAPAADASAAAPAADASAAPAADATPAEPRKPWQLYAGYDYVQANFMSSSPNSPATPNPANQFSTNNLHGNFHQIRGGFRIFDVIGIEAHYGIKASNGDQPDRMGVKNNMGLYFVPTGTLFDTIEISALLGYASTKLENSGNTLTVHGSSYGANIEVPLKPLLGDWMPDLRLGGGVMMYHHDEESRIYGTHFGLRYDFKV